MASYDEILGQVPMQQLASQLGVDESEVELAARTALPALLGGLQANAHDPSGAQSLASALSAHQGASVSNLDDIDEQDGQAIVGNIFGDNPEIGYRERVEVLLRVYGSDNDLGSTVTDVVEKVTGRPARTFAQWAAEHADDFQA